jgi:hypothetical protein
LHKRSWLAAVNLQLKSKASSVPLRRICETPLDIMGSRSWFIWRECATLSGRGISYTRRIAGLLVAWLHKVAEAARKDQKQLWNLRELTRIALGARAATDGNLSGRQLF